MIASQLAVATTSPWYSRWALRCADIIIRRMVDVVQGLPVLLARPRSLKSVQTEYSASLARSRSAASRITAASCSTTAMRPRSYP